MSFYNHGDPIPAVAASAIGAFVPVRAASSPAGELRVVLAASLNEDVLGMTIATAASPGDPINVIGGGWAKGRACASLGAGARVVVGSTNGRLAPAALGAVASNVKNQVGRAMVNAVDADFFAVLIEPQQIV